MSEPETCGATPAAALAEPRFEEGRALHLAGLAGHFKTATCAQEIPLLWNRFGPQIGTIPGQVGAVAYGVVHDGNPESFTYLASVEVSDDAELPADFTTLDIPARRYAVFTHTTHYDQLQHTLAAIWGEWVPRTGITAYGAPCFERYGEEFCPEVGIGGIEIWVPVKEA